MNDLELEREIREAFRRREADVRDPGAIPPVRSVVRRTRRRQLGTVVTATAVVIVVVVGSVAGVSALVRSSERRIPAGPSETPSPTQPSPVPTVVSGSGLEGYTATTFSHGVSDLAAAPDGMVWAATPDGLARLDGDTWTTYPGDTGRLGSVWTVEVAADGTVWAAGERVSRLDGETWTTVAPRSTPYLRDLAVTPWGSVVAGWPDRVARFEGETWTTLRSPKIPDSDQVTAVDVSPVDGRLWLATGFWGGIERVSRFDWELGFGGMWSTWVAPAGLLGSNMGAAAMTVAPDGSVWVVLGGTLARPAYGGTWDLFPLPAPDETGYPETSMAVGPDGTIWIARSDGLLLSFDGTSWTKDRLDAHLLTVEVARDGTLWVATDDSLVRLTPPAE